MYYVKSYTVQDYPQEASMALAKVYTPYMGVWSTKQKEENVKEKDGETKKDTARWVCYRGIYFISICKAKSYIYSPLTDSCLYAGCIAMQRFWCWWKKANRSECECFIKVEERRDFFFYKTTYYKHLQWIFILLFSCVILFYGCCQLFQCFTTNFCTFVRFIRVAFGNFHSETIKPLIRKKQQKKLN